MAEEVEEEDDEEEDEEDEWRSARQRFKSREAEMLTSCRSPRQRLLPSSTRDQGPGTRDQGPGTSLVEHQMLHLALEREPPTTLARPGTRDQGPGTTLARDSSPSAAGAAGARAAEMRSRAAEMPRMPSLGAIRVWVRCRASVPARCIRRAYLPPEIASVPARCTRRASLPPEIAGQLSCWCADRDIGFAVLPGPGHAYLLTYLLTD